MTTKNERSSKMLSSSGGGGNSEHTKEYTVSLNLESKTVQLNNDSIIECFFNENIFSLAMTGRIKFLDRHSILEKGSLTGNESISITFGRENKKTLLFQIHTMERINQVNDQPHGGNQNIIDIVFVEDLYNRATQAKHSRSWQDKKGSDIIKDICKDMLGVTKFNKFEETKEKLSFVMPKTWTPMKAIKYVIERCSGKESGKPGYVLYSGSDGMNFVSIEKLLSSKDKESNNYTFHDHNPEYMNTILSSSKKGPGLSSLSDLSGGQMMGINQEDGERKVRKNNFKKIAQEYTTLGRKTPFTDISNEDGSFTKTDENEESKMDNIFKNNWLKKFLLTGSNIANFICRGSEVREIGKLIECEWASNDPGDMFDKTMMGKWLTTGMTHMFDKASPGFKTNLMCTKNGYEDSDNNSLVPAGKKNTSTVNKLGR